MEPQSAHFWAEKNPGEDLYALNIENRNRPTPGAAREVYDVPHATPWGNRIASYLWTKSIAAGVLLLAALSLHVGFEQDSALLNLFSPALALVFLVATMALLVFDLKRPDRFFYILIKPNFRSWLALGGYVLMLFGVLATVWLVQGLTRAFVSSWVIWASALFAVASACYSAFLFAQARGRNFWQSPLLVWHLLIQSVSAGAAALTLMGGFLGASLPMFYWLCILLVFSLFASLAVIFTDLFMIHGGEEVFRAAELLLRGKLASRFWLLVVGLGAVAPMVLVLGSRGSLPFHMVASCLALLGLWMYENLWIKAGQSVPLS